MTGKGTVHSHLGVMKKSNEPVSNLGLLQPMISNRRTEAQETQLDWPVIQVCLLLIALMSGLAVQKALLKYPCQLIIESWCTLALIDHNFCYNTTSEISYLDSKAHWSPRLLKVLSVFMTRIWWWSVCRQGQTTECKMGNWPSSRADTQRSRGLETDFLMKSKMGPAAGR